MNITETRLQKLARFIVTIHRYYRDYYGMSIADIAHPRHRYLDAKVVETAFSLNNALESKRHDYDIITYNSLYKALHYLDATDLIKVLVGKKPDYDREVRNLVSEYTMTPMYDIELVIKRLKDLVLNYIEDGKNDYIRKDFNSKGKGFRVVDNDDIFFKVLKYRIYENHPLRKQLESLTAEYVEPGAAVPVFASEVSNNEVSGSVRRVYIIDEEPRVDLDAIDNSTLTSLVENRTEDNCEHYILYPIFSKKKSQVADLNDEREVINNITGLVGFKMFINEAYVDVLTKLRNSNGVHQPLYETIPPKGNIVIGRAPMGQDPVTNWSTIEKVETSLPHPIIVKAPEVSIKEPPVLLHLNVDVDGVENTKETKMKIATFELNDTFKLLEYLDNHDIDKKHPVSKRIQDMSGEYARPIPVIRNLINKDGIGDILVITNNEPEGYVSDIIRREDTYWVTVSAYPGTRLEELIEKYQKAETVLLKFHPNYIADDDVPDVIDEDSESIIRSLHCFDYREIKPAKVLKFKK